MEQEIVGFVKDELRQVSESLLSAVANARHFRHGLFNKAVAAIYYGVYHMETALLLSRGIDAKTHEGTHGLFAFHFVKSGEFARETSKEIAALMSARQNADYGRFVEYAEDDVRHFAGLAVGFVGRARELLEQDYPGLCEHSWLDEALGELRELAEPGVGKADHRFPGG